PTPRSRPVRAEPRRPERAPGRCVSSQSFSFATSISVLARLSLKQSRRFHQQFQQLRASQCNFFKALRRNVTHGTNRTYVSPCLLVYLSACLLVSLRLRRIGADLTGSRIGPHGPVAFADFKKFFDRAIWNRVFVAERAGDKAYFTGMFQRFEFVESLF